MVLHNPQNCCSVLCLLEAFADGLADIIDRPRPALLLLLPARQVILVTAAAVVAVAAAVCWLLSKGMIGRRWILVTTDKEQQRFRNHSAIKKPPCANLLPQTLQASLTTNA
jgi:hypothetical protein